MSDIELSALAARVQRLEDEREVQRVLTSYGLAVDSDSVEAMMRLYAEDAVVDIDGTTLMHGREETRQIVEGSAHQAILPTCAHVMGPYVVEVEGDRAVATGYATVFTLQEGRQQVWRQSFGRFDLERREGRWQITRRSSRSLGHEQAFELVRPALR